MNFITTLLNNLNYPAIFVLMLLESTVVPVPSELPLQAMTTPYVSEDA